MLRNIKIIVIIAAIYSLSGCSSTNTMIQSSSSQIIPAPDSNTAQIIFLRPSDYFPAMATLLYDVKPQGDKLISPIGGRNKVVYNIEPGDHLFMSNNGVMSHFLKAEVESGKRYYVLVRPIHGYGFQLRPIRNNGETDYNTTVPEFSSWLANTTIVESSSTAPSTIESNQMGFNAGRDKGFQEWNEKSPSQQMELTLTHEDAISL